jgi:integrase
VLCPARRDIQSAVVRSFGAKPCTTPALARKDWRRVKAVMAAAGVVGTSAMPKGLRHGFGVNAIESGIPPHLLQRWFGHAPLRTKARARAAGRMAHTGGLNSGEGP